MFLLLFLQTPMDEGEFRAGHAVGQRKVRSRLLGSRKGNQIHGGHEDPLQVGANEGASREASAAGARDPVAAQVSAQEEFDGAMKLILRFF